MTNNYCCTIEIFHNSQLLTTSQHIKKQPIILISILDWGLGHATRMIPLVQYLLQFQCQILIAATGQQRKILEQAFPGLHFLSPPEYGVRYSREKRNLVIGLIGQLPRLMRVIKNERKWLAAVHQKYKLDAVISDNRYGMYHPDVHSVIITHQVAPISGIGKTIDTYIRKVHVRYLERFNECWIPDMPDGGLSGKLSHNTPLPKNSSYIGPISRFEKMPDKVRSNGKLLILISGPEPRRTQFERLLLDQLTTYNGDYTLVRGLPGTEEPIPHSLNHASAHELQNLIHDSEFIICRSGYTTVMDLSSMGRTAVLIPTPGQTEQEYLAKYLAESGSFLSCEEHNFDLQREVTRLRNFAPSAAELNFQWYKSALQGLLNKINSQD